MNQQEYINGTVAFPPRAQVKVLLPVFDPPLPPGDHTVEIDTVSYDGTDIVITTKAVSGE